MLKGVTLAHDTKDLGQRIIRLAQRLSDAGEMADWLQAQTGA